MFLSKYGVARHVYVPVVKRAVVDFAVSADWTPATGDVKISKDGGAAANIGTLPAAITMGNTAMWDFTISATEMQAAQVVIMVADSATKAVEDQAIIIETYGNASAQHPFDLATATPSVTVGTGGIVAGSFAAGAIDAGAIATDAIGSAELAAGAVTEIAAPILAVLPAALVGGRIDASVGAVATGAITAGAIAADAIGASELAADAVAEIQSGLASPASILAATLTELSAVPGAGPTLAQAIQFIYQVMRNEMVADDSSATVSKSDGTVIGTATVSTVDPQVTRGKYS